ncbi:MAG: hypothetical protein P4L22_02520 [Candidatus Babeliales bacterium]|nr:hypothetical protein [Candidatus Babeliales bacterium]
MNKKLIILIFVSISLKCFSSEYVVVQKGYTKTLSQNLENKNHKTNSISWKTDGKTIKLDSNTYSNGTYSACIRNNRKSIVFENSDDYSIPQLDFESEITCFSWSNEKNKFAIALGNIIKIYELKLESSQPVATSFYYRYSPQKYINKYSVQEITTLESKDHQGYIYQIRWDESTLISCSYNGYIKVWDLNEEFETKSIHWPFARPTSISCSYDGKKIALSHNSELYICDVENVKSLEKFKFDDNIIMSTYWSPDNSKLAVIIYNTDLLICDLTTYPSSLHILENERMPITGSWSPEGSRFAYKTNANTIEVYQSNN